MSRSSYEHAQIEQRWQQAWENAELFQQQPTASPTNKAYMLFAFAYPSGDGLHVGHVESKTALDILARFSRMNGQDVFFPVGWDAFGLPAENYAIKTGVPPAETTRKAIDTFRGQIKRLGVSYDWANEIATSHPEYYRWTQWLFLQLYKKGLAYRGMGMVNWCPSCQTVLANEQVVDGRCERCDTLVEQKQLEQWYFRITDYREELLSGLEQVDWPEATKQHQRNWVGKSEGVEVTFPLQDSDIRLTCFTTRIDTIFGATFMVISPEKFLELGLESLVPAGAKSEAATYVEQSFKKTEEERKIGEKDKTGVDTGLKVLNPVSGTEVPVYVADYVLAGYGTGVVMGVPAHDGRDGEFARKFGLPIRPVIRPENEFQSVVIKRSVDTGFGKAVRALGLQVYPHEDWGWMISGRAEQFDSYVELIQQSLADGPWYVDVAGFQPTVVFKDAVFSIADEAQNEKARAHARTLGVPEAQIDWQDEQNFLYCFNSETGELINSGKYNGLSPDEAKRQLVQDFSEVMRETTTWKLRDWLISRQRYWGAPIPIVYDPEGKPHPVKEEHLPWLLPTDVDFKPTGESPLKSSKEFIERTERLYGKGWRPEFDTMDTFVDSSWYFLRYLDARNTEAFADPARLKAWLPVDLYLIGPEHIVLHLLYARFFTKFLRDEGYLTIDEPFAKMRHQGMILGPDGKKMSKSKGNVISPDEIIEKYGADTLRVYEMFMGPLEADKPWDDRAVAGVSRFLRRVHALVQEKPAAKTHPQLAQKWHATLKKITEDVLSLKFNTAIAAMMEFVNLWEQLGREMTEGVLSQEDGAGFIKTLAPFAPFLAEELYALVVQPSGDQYAGVHVQSWPPYDPELARSETVTLGVQVDGKLRAQLEIPADQAEDKAMVLESARALKELQKWLNDKKIVKEIYVPGRIISFVTE